MSETRWGIGEEETETGGKRRDRKKATEKHIETEIFRLEYGDTEIWNDINWRELGRCKCKNTYCSGR